MEEALRASQYSPQRNAEAGPSGSNEEDAMSIARKARMDISFLKVKMSSMTTRVDKIQHSNSHNRQQLRNLFEYHNGLIDANDMEFDKLYHRMDAMDKWKSEMERKIELGREAMKSISKYVGEQLTEDVRLRDAIDEMEIRPEEKLTTKKLTEWNTKISPLYKKLQVEFEEAEDEEEDDDKGKGKGKGKEKEKDN